VLGAVMVPVAVPETEGRTVRGQVAGGKVTVMARLPEMVAVQTLPATEVQPTQVGESAVGPGVAVRMTVVVPVNDTVPEQFKALPVMQLMAGVVWLVTTDPEAVPPPDRAVTVRVAVTPSVNDPRAATGARSPWADAGSAERRKAAAAARRSVPACIHPPWGTAKKESVRPVSGVCDIGDVTDEQVRKRASAGVRKQAEYQSGALLAGQSNQYIT
jgi:hypothetical protein